MGNVVAVVRVGIVETVVVVAVGLVVVGGGAVDVFRGPLWGYLTQLIAIGGQYGSQYRSKHYSGFVNVD